MIVMVNVWKLRPDNPGHVSLQVGTTYMSYWPADAAGKNDIKLGQTHDISFPRSYATDARIEKHEADERRNLTGLATDDMLAAWQQFQRDRPRYNMVAHNCSTVIAGLLEIGSGIKPSFVSSVAIDDHASNWATRLFLRVRFLSASIKMWTPDAVLQYADEISRQR